MENDNDIDQLFKDGLNDPEIPFNEADWKKMERKLDAQKKKRIVPLLAITMSGIAAALVVVLLWVYSNPDTGLPSDKNTISLSKPAVKSVKAKSINDGKETAVGTGTETNIINDDSNISQPAEKANNYPAAGLPSSYAMQLNLTKTQLSHHPFDGAFAYNRTITAGAKRMPDQKVNINILSIPRQTDSSEIVLEKANALAQTKDDPFERNDYYKSSKNDRDALTRSIQKKMDASLAKDHQLIISAMAAPDISTAKASTSSKISSNVGMLATYALGKKISLTSGAIYSKKYYNSEGTSTVANTYTSANTAWEVYADCNVLDIPLNVNYKMLNNKKLSVSFNTGLSSYFMLREKYEFVTDQPDGTKNVSKIQVNNENQHLFGVANVSVSFDHQITNTVSIGIQPFAKLPLTGIGNGSVRLKSAGVSFSLNIGLFPVKKTGGYASLR